MNAGPPKALLALLSLALLSIPPRAAQACACCSDPGERTESTKKLEGYEKEVLEKVRFARTTRLLLRGVGLGGVRGIPEPQETYTLTVARDGDAWTFQLEDAHKHRGTLRFAPTAVTSFFVDPQDPSRKGEVVLYKEWRLEGPVTRTGIFAPADGGAAPAVRLVLQGNGNSCTEAAQFRAYSLTVSGPAEQYTFYGPLAPPAR